MTWRDVRMRGFSTRADADNVMAWVDARPVRLDAEDVGLFEAAGRVLSSDVVSRIDVPTFARSSMDGWAVRGETTLGATDAEPLSLHVVGESRPGAPPPHALADDAAMRIRTGAPLPPGADAVLPAESGEEHDGRLSVRGEVPPHRNVAAIGEDVQRGATVLRAGRVLRPQDVAMLSTLGLPRVAVRRRPRVVIIVTGAEVLAAGSPPAPHRVPDANGPMLDALVRRDGGVSTVVGPLADDDPALEAAIASADGDVVLVAGSSSVGPEDVVPALVAKRGEIAFHGVALRPASPAGVGVVAGRPVFLLPGNPVSALCAYDLFASRLVRRLAGRSPELPYANLRAPLARKIVSELGRLDVMRVRLVDGLVEPMTARGAGVLSTVTRADGFVLVPKSVEGWPEGTLVDVRLYDALPSGGSSDRV